MSTSPIFFTKMSGAGNTFILISSANTAWDYFEKQTKMPRLEFAKFICGKTFGFAADGFLILDPGSDSIDYHWDFYNSDGSPAEMCGNAARCAARYCYEYIENRTRSHFKFMTGAGVVEAIILADKFVRVQMPPIKWIQKDIELRIHQSNLEKFAFVNTGVPHLVQKLHSIGRVTSMKEMAQEARSHQDVRPDGSNVTFYSIDSESRIQAVTFERGVEDYTLACGTGAVAAALVHHAQTSVSAIEVAMPGGNLRVIFVANDPRPFLEGEADFVGDFRYSSEVFL